MRRGEGKGGERREMKRVPGISTIKSKTLLGRIFGMPFFLVIPRLCRSIGGVAFDIAFCIFIYCFKKPTKQKP